MNSGIILGANQPDHQLKTPKDRATAGFAIGILVIECWYPLMPGNVANASTYNFPVVYKIIEGTTWEQLSSGDPAVLDLIIKGGKALMQQGARALVGACGSFAYYQKEAAAVLNVPVFLSVMLQVPLILQSLKEDQKIGVIVASKTALTSRVFKECEIEDPSRLIIRGADSLPEFKNIMEDTGKLNSHHLEKEIVVLAQEMIKSHREIGAILLQCSDLPPYAWAIQNAVKLPVFDMTTLINWIYNAVVRRPFVGFI